MPDKRLYDTRFFAESFYTSDQQLARKLGEEFKSQNEKFVSSLTVHEIYRLVLRTDGRVVAAMRSSTIKRDFQVVDVDYEIAVKSAELRSRHQMPMADSVIAASAQVMGCIVFSDDAHFKQVRDLRTAWV
jgi:predicted nucleic acid-binding protein